MGKKRFLSIHASKAYPCFGVLSDSLLKSTKFGIAWTALFENIFLFDWRNLLQGVDTECHISIRENLFYLVSSRYLFNRWSHCLLALSVDDNLSCAKKPVPSRKEIFYSFARLVVGNRHKNFMFARKFCPFFKVYHNCKDIHPLGWTLQDLIKQQNILQDKIMISILILIGASCTAIIISLHHFLLLMVIKNSVTSANQPHNSVLSFGQSGCKVAKT